jgi:membrane protein implicated in regulation of membrane protease activity
MSVLRQVFSEIYDMFAGDAIMTASAIIIVAIAAALHFFTPTPSRLIGFALFASSVALLVMRVYQHALRSTREN